MATTNKDVIANDKPLIKIKHGCIKNYRYEKTGDGKLKIVFTMDNVESSMELLHSSVSLFSFNYVK